MASLDFTGIINESVGGLGQVGQGLLGNVGTEGAIGGGRFGNASNLALGDIDAQAFLAQHPEFQEGWDNAIATGDDPMRWLPLAINAASYVDQSTIPRGGGVAGTLQGLTGAASGMETGANTALRGSNLADMKAFGGGMADVYRQANPEVYSSLQSASALGGSTAYSPVQAQGYSAQGYDAATYNPMASLSADQLQQGMLGGSLYGQAMQAGPNSASQALLGRATSFANSTGQLSPMELRSVQQGTREAFAARGLEMSNPAITAEVGNRIAAERSRMTEDLGLAAMLGNAYNQDLASSRGFSTGVYGQELGRQGQNQGANLQAGMSNQNAYNQAGQFNASSTNQARQFQADAFNQAAQYNAQAANQMGLANAQLGMQQQQQDRGYALNLAGSYQNAAYDPTRLLGATSGAPGMAGGMLGVATGYNPDMGQYFNQTSGIANDVAMTKYNAEMAAKNSKANNKAGIWSSVLGAVGTVGGAMLGGPMGAALGAKLGSSLGGGGNNWDTQTGQIGGSQSYNNYLRGGG